MKRPIGVTVICVALALLSLAGFGNMYLDLTDGGAFGTVVSVMTLFYGMSALVASIGLWKLKSWSYRAFLVWAAVAMAIGMYETPISSLDVPLLGHITLWFAIGMALWWVARYIRKVELKN